MYGQKRRGQLISGDFASITNMLVDSGIVKTENNKNVHHLDRYSQC